MANPNKLFLANISDWVIGKSFNLQSDTLELPIVLKIENGKRKIEDIANMFSGIKVYEVGKGSPSQTEKIRDTKPYTSEKKESKGWYVFYDGKDIGRYQLNWNKNNWIQYGKWLAAPREPENFDGEKILIRKIIGKTLISTYIPTTSYCNTLLFVLKLKIKIYSYKSILGILNSTLIGWYFRKKFQISNEDTFPQIMIRDILQFPIPEINSKFDSELNKYVDLLLKLNEEIKEEKLQTKIEQIKQRIEHSEEKINELVYELYELTSEEIKIVEGDK